MPLIFWPMKIKAMPGNGWRPPASREAHSAFIQPLPAPEIDRLPFEQLLRFWQHPVRAFFQQRLRVNFRSEESEIPNDEPFILEGLSRYQLNQQLLNTLIEEQDASAMYRRFRAAGELPYGAFGELAWKPSVRRCKTWPNG